MTGNPGSVHDLPPVHTLTQSSGTLGVFVVLSQLQILTTAGRQPSWETAATAAGRTALASCVGRGAESDLQLTHAATHDAF
ncbi:hypothetical protein CSOJ01_07838 [Colletotrichum sojae]|uniref:Uncharacterized protein n=1 Tax=Colletotrichum sojae TaxID=2175907 RepID=A0A8H6J801_9PEZI|nr:hypothetical protein CSOJ01_07838 [Colletotrichum sojae]